MREGGKGGVINKWGRGLLLPLAREFGKKYIYIFLTFNINPHNYIAICNYVGGS